MERQLLKKYDCIGLGVAPLDILSVVSNFPDAGSKIDITRMVITGGGPVPTALATLSKLGYKCAFIGKCGDDLHGCHCRQAFVDAGISTRYLEIVKGGITPTALILVEKQTGRRTVMLSQGKDCRITVREVNEAAIIQARAIHLDGRDLAACKTAARIARNNDVITFFDIGSVRNKVDSIFPFIDHLGVSEEYARHQTGETNAEQAAKKLFCQSMKSIVVTIGERGAVGFDGRNLEKVRAFKVKALDTTGAGDAFHGGYIYSVLHGYPLRKRLRFATAVASCNCRQVGGRDGLPSLAQVKRMIRHGRLI